MRLFSIALRALPIGIGQYESGVWNPKVACSSQDESVPDSRLEHGIVVLEVLVLIDERLFFGSSHDREASRSKASVRRLRIRMCACARKIRRDEAKVSFTEDNRMVCRLSVIMVRRTCMNKWGPCPLKLSTEVLGTRGLDLSQLV